jgi:hypothetical protein
MKGKLGWVAVALTSLGLYQCTPPAQPEPGADVSSGATSGSEQPCQAKFQARRAYASFQEPPGEHAMAIAALETEEILASLRQTGCAPRSDLPMHAAMVDALGNGALIVTGITFITPELDVVEVIASEASYGDAAAPEARSFSIRLRRARPAQPSSYTAEGVPDEVPVEAWHITGLDLRPAGAP